MRMDSDTGVLIVTTFSEDDLSVIAWLLGVDRDNLSIKDASRFVRNSVKAELQFAHDQYKTEQMALDSQGKEQSYKYYSLINPSDVYTLRAKSDKIAILAAFSVGGGAYGLEDEKCVRVLPIVNNIEEWYEQKFGEYIHAALTANYEAVADCLDSFAIVSKGEREDYYDWLDTLPTADRDRDRAQVLDMRRTSLNNIGERAYRLAKHWREKFAAQQKEQQVDARINRLLQR